MYRLVLIAGLLASCQQQTSLVFDVPAALRHPLLASEQLRAEVAVFNQRPKSPATDTTYDDVVETAQADVTDGTQFSVFVPLEPGDYWVHVRYFAQRADAPTEEASLLPLLTYYSNDAISVRAGKVARVDTSDPAAGFQTYDAFDFDRDGMSNLAELTFGGAPYDNTLAPCGIAASTSTSCQPQQIFADPDGIGEIRLLRTTDDIFITHSMDLFGETAAKLTWISNGGVGATHELIGEAAPLGIGIVALTASTSAAVVLVEGAGFYECDVSSGGSLQPYAPELVGSRFAAEKVAAKIDTLLWSEAPVVKRSLRDISGTATTDTYIQLDAGSDQAVSQMEILDGDDMFITITAGRDPATPVGLARVHEDVTATPSLSMITTAPVLSMAVGWNSVFWLWDDSGTTKLMQAALDIVDPTIVTISELESDPGAVLDGPLAVGVDYVFWVSKSGPMWQLRAFDPYGGLREDGVLVSIDRAIVAVATRGNFVFYADAGGNVYRLRVTPVAL